MDCTANFNGPRFMQVQDGCLSCPGHPIKAANPGVFVGIYLSDTETRYQMKYVF